MTSIPPDPTDHRRTTKTKTSPPAPSTLVTMHTLANKLKQEKEQLRVENRHLRQTTKEQQREMEADYRRRLEAHRLKWQQNRETAIRATVAQLTLHYDTQIKAVMARKDKEIALLKSKALSAGKCSSSQRGLLLAKPPIDSSNWPRPARKPPLASKRPAIGIETLPEERAVEATTMACQLSKSNSETLPRDTSRQRRRPHSVANNNSANTTGRSRLPILLQSFVDRRRPPSTARSAWDIYRLSDDEDDTLLPHGDAASGMLSTSMSASMTTSSTLPRNNSKKATAFGGLQTVSKEEHEREKGRLLQKVDDADAQLQKAESVNFDLTQARAELKKRVLELEKNQKPLMDNNRRLEERNRNLMTEMRKLDGKLRHSQDDYLTLRDAFDRVTAENAKFKEKRFTPEKQDELERYKQQNLEYSKCITALRQAAIEKDRRIDLLLMKLKRLRKSHRAHSMDRSALICEDDRSIEGGSECSISSISLDTIAEDFEELQTSKDIRVSYQQLAREHQELQKAFAALKLSAVVGANAAEADTDAKEQERLVELERHLVTERQNWIEKLQGAQRRLEQSERERERLRVDIGDLREQNELLEFQILEMEHSSSSSNTRASPTPGPVAIKPTSCSTCDRSVSTSDDDEAFCSNNENSDDQPTLELSEHDLKTRLTLLKHRQALSQTDRQVIVQSKNWIDQLITEQEKLHALLDLKVAEYKELEIRLQEEVQHVNKEETRERDRRTDLEQEVDFLHRRITEVESNHEQLLGERTTEKRELDRIRYQLKAADERERRTNADLVTARAKLADTSDARRAEIDLMERSAKNNAEVISNLRDELEQQRTLTAKHLAELTKLQQQQPNPEPNSDASTNSELLQKYSDAKAKLKEALKVVKDYETVLSHARSNEQQLQRRVKDGENLQEYNRQLECQFQTQLKMMETMKSQIQGLQATQTVMKEGVTSMTAALNLGQEARHKVRLICQQQPVSEETLDPLMGLRTAILQLLKQSDSCRSYPTAAVQVLCNGGGRDVGVVNGSSVAMSPVSSPNADGSDEDESGGEAADETVADSGLHSLSSNTSSRPQQRRKRKKDKLQEQWKTNGGLSDSSSVELGEQRSVTATNT